MIRRIEMGSYFQRYVQGECVTVWDELDALGDQVREEPLLSDAWAVARETMRRVRTNFELVTPRLRQLGYIFIHDLLPDTEHIPSHELEWIQRNPPLHTAPPWDIIEQLDHFEREVGTLPLSLRAFYQEVGGFNFIGWYKGPSAKSSFTDEHLLFVKELDPLFVYAFDPKLVEEEEVMSADRDENAWAER